MLMIAGAQGQWPLDICQIALEIRCVSRGVFLTKQRWLGLFLAPSRFIV